MSVNSKMTALADEVRELSGATGLLGIDAMTSNLSDVNDEVVSQESLIAQIASALEGKIAGSEISLPELTNPATASDALSGKEFIDADGNKVTGTIVTKTSSDLTASGATVTVPAGYYASQATKSVSTATQATPSISVSSAGLITASATQTAGYVSAGTKSATKQLTVKAAQTITPSTTDKTIASGTYLTGTQTIKGDANLVAENIAEGVSIFGVTGTHAGGSGSGSGGAVETCTVIGNGFEGTCYYSNGTQIINDAESLYFGTPITVAKNSLLAFDFFSPINDEDSVSVSGDAEIIQEGSSTFRMAVYGDCEIQLELTNSGPM